MSDCLGVPFFAKPMGALLCELVLIVGLLLSPQFFSRFENTDIGSLLEKDSYRESYYVYVRSDKNEAKAYRLKADIRKGNYGHPDFTDEGEWTFRVEGNGYFLEKVYWGNGGYLTFLDEYETPDGGSSARVYPDRETRVSDYKDVTYYVTLTRDKVE